LVQHRVPANKKLRNKKADLTRPVRQDDHVDGSDAAAETAETREGAEDGPLQVTVDEVLSAKESRRLAAITLPKDSELACNQVLCLWFQTWEIEPACHERREGNRCHSA
jgi:hypothetical protein